MRVQVILRILDIQPLPAYTRSVNELIIESRSVFGQIVLAAFQPNCFRMSFTGDRCQSV